MGRGILLWLLGIPIPIIILIMLFWHWARTHRSLRLTLISEVAHGVGGLQARIMPAGSAAELILIAGNRKYWSSRLSCGAAPAGL